jgi:chromosome segregation ATPase
MSSRLQQLDQERAKQQDMIYNADFKLEQMNRKVARGLGERSTEEKERLTKRINELNEEQIASKSRNKELEQQAKILHQELKKWSRQYIECAKSNPDLQNAIIEVELEIKSCELNSEKIQRDKEEEMVALDLVRLEVRRLRDILNTKATEVYELEDAREQQRGKMNTRKNKLCEETEVMTAHLRAVEDERHHCAIEFGQRSIMAEKIQLKYEMITKAHNTGDNGDGRSQVFNLIAAAQKRADLQLEGDRLDTRIRKKETEMKAIQKTLVQLKGRNSTFRRSFARLDKESGEYKHILRLKKELEASEKMLFEVKKSAQTYVRSTESLSRELETLRTSQGKLKQENEKLDKERCSLDEDTDIIREEELTLQLKLERERYVMFEKNFVSFLRAPCSLPHPITIKFKLQKHESSLARESVWIFIARIVFPGRDKGETFEADCQDANGNRK